MNYNLICSKCWKKYDDSKEGEWRLSWLSCNNEKDPDHGKALLIYFYLNQNEEFSLNSKETKEKLNLQNLWISFNRFIENRDYFLSSCTFKKLEATSIFSRMFSNHLQI